MKLKGRTARVIVALTSGIPTSIPANGERAED
jgi:hypothetical protein